jgi:pyridoxal biosynthesis lyase PdxS
MFVEITKSDSDQIKSGTYQVKSGFAQMLKGGVIMDVVNV